MFYSTNQIATAAVVVVYLEIAHPVGNDEALNQWQAVQESRILARVYQQEGHRKVRSTWRKILKHKKFLRFNVFYNISLLISFDKYDEISLGSHKIPIITDYESEINLQNVEQDEEERKRMSTGYHGPSADWTANASSISHIFVPTSNTGDSCYVNQDDCKHSGNLYNNKQECNVLHYA